MPLSPTRSYLTVASPATAEIEVRRSRFRCDLDRVETEEAARAFIERVRAGSRDARHHCTAFVLGPDGMTQRSNDDGEPSGTAGAPMLEVLRGRGLSDVVAVVTRWFGGTLLGTGGLIRAYGDAVQAALDAATTVRREERRLWSVEVRHEHGPRVENALRGRAAVAVTDAAWGTTTLTLGLAVDPASGLDVTALVAELTGGAAEPVEVGHTWVDVAVDGSPGG
ncbi:hypothetical protein N865_21545 [Intrasporangium oryzae NRRL B-24470]|uniref:Impact N-terminal domain-containing protein n=1 Tax=Intrasporangium oryzae NRRL B-24470 TaxID=1386089 RepID=W9G307_9MICO|nr:YigZ family protein [Intrasporangium oryzae]EWS99676.1 hypothetical protein N865_21545 [Intrasporangium oryzae NRRL B-24470]